MNYFLSTIIVYLFLFNTSAQNSPNRERLIAQAKMISQSVIEEDHHTTLKLTYPKLVQKMGGIENGIKLLEKTAQEFREKNQKISKVKIGKPSKIYQAGNELHCLVPQKIEMKVEEGKLVTNSHLLAISSDGQNWYFMDVSIFDNDNINQAFPNFNRDLILPEKQKPVLHRRVKNRE